MGPAPPAPVPAVVAPLPVVGTPVVAQAATAASSQSTSQSTNDGEKSGNYVWSDNGQKFEVNYRGDIEFTDDDSDVSRMGPGGYLRIKDGKRFGTDNSVEFRAGSGGAIERRFWVSGRERPFDPEGRKWLAEVLPRFIRQSGIGAKSRVARFMKSGGAAAVLAEISRIEGSWAKRVYFTELFNQPGLSGAHYRAGAGAGRARSRFGLRARVAADLQQPDRHRRCRQAHVPRGRADDWFGLRAAPRAVVDCQGRTDDAGHRRVGPRHQRVDRLGLRAGLAARRVRRPSAARRTRRRGLLQGARRSLQFVRAQPGAQSGPAANRSPEPVRVAALESGAAIESDFEAASFLTEFVKISGVEGAARAPFFRAVASIDSAFERGRVLQALSRRSDVSDQTVLEILRSAQSINSNFERAQVLLALAGTHPLTREAREIYIDAADNLGDFEQGRVLSALVKNERRQ